MTTTLHRDVDLVSGSATDLLAALRARRISSRELLDEQLNRIAAVNPMLNAVVTLDAEAAHRAAAQADEATARGTDVGALHGLPMTIKDSLETAGLRTTAGAPDLASYVPHTDADAVARLRQQGAVIVGKTNLPTYAMDWQTANPVFGVTNNPWDLTRTPGGSSGGAAAAVAAGLSPLELGSDIRGSLRQPAHNCGVFTLKPSFGIVPGRGHIPGPPGSLSGPDMGVLGPIARTADDLDLALDVLVGPDAAHAVGWRLRLPEPRGRSLADYRIAVWLDDPYCPIDDAVGTVLAAAIDELRLAGAQIDDRARPVDLSSAAPLFESLFQAAVSPGAADGNVLREQQAQLRARWAAFFRDYDLVLTPVSPVPAITHDHRPAEQRTISVNGQPRPYTDQSIWTGLAGAAYLPAAVAPVGCTDTGLPVGIQIIAPYLEDRTAIDLARWIERTCAGLPGNQSTKWPLLAG